MVSHVGTMGLQGIDGYRISCECDLSGGLPAFDIVGLPDAAVREARERVRAAVKNCGFEFPLRRITVNLAPADTRKEGPLYDLPILLSILCASGQLPPPPEDAAFFGELSLDGKLRPVSGALPAAAGALSGGVRHLFVPARCAREASFAGEELFVYPVSHVRELCDHLRGDAELLPAPVPEAPEDFGSDVPDFSDVMGQENARRAMEIAAAGGHNILLIGPPGAGKSMLARRLPSILPEMQRDELLESTKIHSVAGLTNHEYPLLSARPFRSPHHTVSGVALAGGGQNPRPGEISLAHNGVLFLDELPEFRKDALEILRQPLEDGRVTISRATATLTFPCRFMLVCAMNPCRCGWLGHPSGRCSCSRESVRQYRGRISGPLLDRIDLQVYVPAVKFDELSAQRQPENSADIRARVMRARELQLARFAGTELHCNAHMTPQLTRANCRLGAGETELLRAAFENLGMSARGYDRVLKVARTIADLDGCSDIAAEHLAEAIQYRSLDRSVND